MTFWLSLGGAALAFVGVVVGYWLRHQRALDAWERGYQAGLNVGQFARMYSRPEGDGLTETERWKREWLARQAHPLGHQTVRISAASAYEAFCRLTQSPR